MFRNPLDVLTSYFNLKMQQDWCPEANPEDFENFAEVFYNFVAMESTVYKENQNQASMMGMARHLVRVEDLESKPKAVLTEMMMFVLHCVDLEGTRVGKYIDLLSEEIIAGKIRSNFSYKPLNHLVSDKLKRFLGYTMKSSNEITGYNNVFFGNGDIEDVAAAYNEANGRCF